jgi:hypothetical protein
LPTRGDESVGTIWRGERLIHGGDGDFFDSGFVSNDGKPSAGQLDELTGGILWLQPLLATQTSVVYDGWSIGDGLEHAATSWDAWKRARPDDTRHEWNEPAQGMPRVREQPLLPRRVRLEIEYEDPAQRRRRTRLSADLAATEVSFNVDDETRLPKVKSFILVDAEWMLLRTKNGKRVTVQRGMRGSKAAYHAAGARISHGGTVFREVEVPTYREDWKL